MAQLRGLLYVGFIVAVVIGWYVKRRKDHVASDKPQTDVPPKQLATKTKSIEDALIHPNWTIRLEALETLLKNQNANIMEILLDMLADPIIDIRQIAIAELVTYGEAAFAELDEILNTNNLSARESAIQTLVGMHSPTSSPLLAKALLHDESAWVRTPAAQGLGEIGDDEACGALIRALDDTHPDVLDAIRQALQKIGTQEALEAIRA